MKYYAKCNNVLNYDSVKMIDEEDVAHFTINHSKIPEIYGLDIVDEINNTTYEVNYNPLRFEQKFHLLDANKQQVITIKVGSKYLHRVEYGDKTLSCKGTLSKVSYKLYDIDNVIASLNVIKINKNKYYKIELADNKNIMIALTILVVAQSIRERLFAI